MNICRYHQTEYTGQECPLCVIEEDEKAVVRKFNITSMSELRKEFQPCPDSGRSSE
jgi:hypothetical protein